MTNPPGGSDGVYLELYVRSLVQPGVQIRQDAVLDRLQHLVDRGAIADYTVTVCGKYLPASGGKTDVGSLLRARVATFEAWADRNDFSLQRLFQRRHVDSSVTGESFSAIAMPVMALAEYVGEDLRFVAPCQVGDERHVTVEDRLDELDATDPSLVEAEPLEDVRRSSPSAELQTAAR